MAYALFMEPLCYADYMFYAPINGITWAIGSIPTLRFGIRSFQPYETRKNPVAKIYGYFCTILGLSFLCFALPMFITNDTHILKYTSWGADVLIQIGMQVLIWLGWFLGLRNRIRLGYLLAIGCTYSFVMLTYEFFSSSATIDNVHHLVVYSNHPPVLIMQCIIYLGLSWPIAGYFLFQLPKQSDLKAKLKNLMNASIFFVVSSAVSANDIFDKGSDTVSGDLVLVIFFVLFLIISFVPRKNLSAESSASS